MSPGHNGAVHCPRLRDRSSSLSSFRKVSYKTVAALLVVHVAALLASQAEAFIPIFTYSEVQRIQEKERNKGQKKYLSEQQRSEEVGPLDLAGPTAEKEDQVITLTAPMEIGIRMNSRRLEKYRAAMEGLLSEVLLSTQDGTAAK
ncbi:promotilin [Desmodus rotundus]|uniref:promotilin n=1 Tax=Desmodus rotundus TaxID=9430 RepID=UPI0023813E11|nr:promotilin [Desmodus rotundus]